MGRPALQFPYPMPGDRGGLLGFVPRLPQPQFDPQFTLVLVLRRFSIRRTAHVLARVQGEHPSHRVAPIGLVLATTLAVGSTLKLLIPDIPWAARSCWAPSFLLPTRWRRRDPVAAQHPGQVVTVLEGESLSTTRRPGDLQIRGRRGAHRDVLAVAGEPGVRRRPAADLIGFLMGNFSFLSIGTSATPSSRC